MKWFRVLFLLSICSLLGDASAAETQSINGDDNCGLSSIISKSLLEKLLKDRANGNCSGSFYTYEAFIEAAKSFSGFGTTGDTDTRKRDVAAFLGQTSYDTAGGYPKAYLPAYCQVDCFDTSGGNFCVNPHYPCNSSVSYYSRGAIQMSYNQDYWEVGKYLGLDLINHPELVSTDPVISFKSAFWYWMIPRWPRPSCHDVITGKWKPSEADQKAGRLPGYGVTTNILNGGLACGSGPNEEVNQRTEFYMRYCKELGVSPGDNLDCYNQEQYPGGGVCGLQGFGALCCRRGQCCDRWGFCGTSDDYCGTRCQSQCGGGGTDDE